MGTRCHWLATWSAAEYGLTSVTMTRPPPPAVASADWNARTSATRRDAAVIRTLSDFTMPPGQREILVDERRAFGNRAGEHGADELRLAERRQAVAGTQRRHVVRRHQMARRKGPGGAQGSAARRP